MSPGSIPLACLCYFRLLKQLYVSADFVPSCICWFMFLASPALGLCLLEPCTELGNPFFKSERRMLVALPVLLRAYQAEVESLFFKTQPFTALIRNDNIKKALCRERCASQNLEVCASCLLGLLYHPGPSTIPCLALHSPSSCRRKQEGLRKSHAHP